MFFAHENTGYTHFTVAQKGNLFYPETFIYENSKRYISEQTLLDVKDIIIKPIKEVIAMYNGDEEDSYFIVTHKEQEMLNQLRELSDEDRAEVTRRFLEIALKYAEWGE